ncbi:MAG: HAMP domain-containing protein, partial [Gammaproteobacteria bacterium]
MTLARRLTFSIFGVLALFAVNVVTFTIGNRSVRESLDAVSDAVRGQINAGELRQRLDANHKQLLVLLALRQSTGQGMSRQEAERAGAEMESMAALVERMRRNTNGQSAASYDALMGATQLLFADWRQLLGELSGRGTISLPRERLRDRHLQATTALEAFYAAVTEVSRVESGAVEQTGRITGRITLAVFLSSIALTALLGFLLMRHTNESLFRLRRGTVRIGRGDLEYRIPVLADDEFGQLATAFNEMAKRLRDAVAEVREAKEQADRANAAKSGFLANMSHE